MSNDEMGRSAESLLAWMREVAIARDDFTGKHRTVNLKISTATLRMWVQRVDDAIGQPSDGPDGRYEVRHYRWGFDHGGSRYSDLAVALQAAFALDNQLDNGDNGIAFLRDHETGKRANVGNDWERAEKYRAGTFTVSDLEWYDDAKKSTPPATPAVAHQEVGT